MTWAAVFSGLGFAGIAVWLAVRLANRADVLADTQADRALLSGELGAQKMRAEQLEQRMQVVAEEVRQQRERWDREREALRVDIQELERDLEGCQTPEAVRARLRKLLSAGLPS